METQHEHVHEAAHEGHCHHAHHHHDHAEGAEEALTMLRYTIDHNEAHAAELPELADQFNEEAKSLVMEARELFMQGNQKLRAALEAAAQGGE